MNVNPIVQNQFTDLMNEMYDFEPYFELLLSREFFKSRGIPIVNEYPLLETSIRKYRKALQALKKKKYDKKIMLTILENETFTQDIGLNHNPNSYYTIHWDITKLKKLVHCSGISITIRNSANPYC
ncbi:hypothetical protein D0469_05640 [Peribacillus saganii]|uniref:Uncharacterized protein n=1 Tax=Peribacillus saganii TaxID=2303992 RepID=A0A372LRE6_9BACI|nr:hypothetical protein [Peribacillus saganii]RFU70616.1 hypothetical protein D0469_05640 [Peribacillus saganii]